MYFVKLFLVVTVILNNNIETFKFQYYSYEQCIKDSISIKQYYEDMGMLGNIETDCAVIRDYKMDTDYE